MKLFKLTLLTASLLIFGLGETAIAQLSGTGSNSSVEYVSGYTKSNGTTVQGYYRTKANSYNLDNFSAKGNYNPYTGNTGTKTYKSAYNSYKSTTYTYKSSYNSSFNTSSTFKSTYPKSTTSSLNTSYSFDFDFD